MFDANEYIKEYRKKNYDTVLLRLRKGERDILQDDAASVGMSVNQYIIAAIEYYKREGIECQ